MMVTAQPGSAEIPVLPPGVQVTTFENGLTLIVREDHSAPVVSVQAWCRAGSIHEGHWLGAGLSHVLEHMLFKGTTSRGPGQIDQEVQDAGGYMNAYTSFDRTVYHIDVPNTGATVAIDILCDIMQHATLPPDELEKEKQVILREMDMNQDDPRQRSARRLFETAYTQSPYRFTVIGYPDIFNELQRVDIHAYYREKYAPNNLFFVVVGDLDPAAAIAQIRTGFAQAKARPIPALALAEELPQVATRVVIEEAPIELTHLHFAWHIPALRHPDVPLLDVLATLLGGGRSSRLYQEVREKQGLVNSIDAWTYSPGNPGLFGMSAVVNPDKYDSARAAMLAELDRLKTQGVTPEEVNKAIKQFVSGTLAARKTMQGQAQDLGANWLAAQDLNFSQRYLAAVKRATPEALRRVAREYLHAENQTLYALLPEGTKPRLSLVSDAVVQTPIRKIELTNGLRVLVKPDHRLPFVEMRLVFQGGVLAENPQNNGITLLTAKMLLQGTPTRTAEQIARDIESWGGSIDSYGGNNSFGLYAEVMHEDFSAGLELLADLTLNPLFPETALEREKAIQLASIRAQRDQLLQSAGRLMRHGLFGDSGYGLDVQGSENSVNRIQAGDLRAFHRALVVPNNAVLAIFGDVDPAQIQREVDATFGLWPRGSDRTLKNGAPTLAEIRRVTDLRNKRQAVLLIGFPGCTIYNPDRYALELLQESCSDLGSRLFARIRDRLGLAYYVGAQNFLGLSPGYFAFYVGTEPEKVSLVEQEMLAEAALLRSEGLSADELKRAKAKVIGQKKIARQDLGTYALTAALDELYGLGYAHSDEEDARYEAVTLEQTRAIAQKYLRPDALIISVVQPPLATPTDNAPGVPPAVTAPLDEA